MGKTATIHADDHPDELRRKLALLGMQSAWLYGLFSPDCIRGRPEGLS